MRSYRYLHYDVFTDHLFGGNQLAVVLDSRGLSAITLQAIANEMNFSETTFVLPAEQPDTDVRMRIFTPGDELPMAGHPTIGSTFALARSGVIGPDTRRFVFGLGIGPTPVSLTWKNKELTFAWMTQRPPEFGEAGTVLSLQGVKMGRPSHVHISIGLEGREVTSVRVGGQSVVAGEGTLYL